MITYNWTIAQLERSVADGGVLTAHWRVTAQDGDYAASTYGTAGFAPDPSDSDFIPFERLTEANVLKWVWGSVNRVETEANLAKQIEDQKTPKVVASLPWA
jgi:hypothetical protein